MPARSQRIGWLLISGAVIVLVVAVAPWCYYGVTPTPVARLSQSRVRDWSLKVLGGRVGITETAGFRRTLQGVEKDTFTEIWLGPLGRFAVPVRAPVATLRLPGILLLGLGSYRVFKLHDEKRTV